MLTAAPVWRTATVEHQLRRTRRTWWMSYAGVLAATAAIAGLAALTAPRPFTLAAVIVFGGALIALCRPVMGIYMTVLLAVTGDAVTAYWYPFTKNLSSRESVLFVADQLPVSPLELYIAALALGWVLHMLGTRRWELRRTPFLKPLLIFTAFVVTGLVWGLARGGNSNVALWEARPLLYLPVLYVVITNVFDRREQYIRLYWVAMSAVCINGILALVYYAGLPAAKRLDLESLIQHGNAVPMNAMFVMLIGLWLFRGQGRQRAVLTIMAVPVVAAYLLSERRAAIIALVAAIVLIGAVLRGVDHRRFRIVAPIVIIVGVGYLGAFWGAEGTVGFPAQAVKSVVAPGQLSEKDASSDLYRQIENYDVVSTIKSNPVLGIGFGQQFLRPLPLPDISFFVFYEYVPHNSILWVWMKTGILGFLAMLYLFGSVLRTGTRTLMRADLGDAFVPTLTSVAYVAMYGVFAFVDIAWDPQNMVFMAVALAQLAHVASSPPAPAPAPESSDALVGPVPVGSGAR